jgi:hypothetical protein
MKKAKFFLSLIIIIAIVSALLGLKTNRRGVFIFYGYGTSTTAIGGPSVTGCVVPTTLLSTTTVFGGILLTCISSTTFITTTCSSCTARVTAALTE